MTARRVPFVRLLAQQFIDTGLDLLFPPRCLVCGCVGSLFCFDCQVGLAVPEPVNDAPLLERRAGAYYGGPIREAIWMLKYKHQPRYAQPLAERLYAVYANAGWQADLVLPAALHPDRRKARGYDQSALLAASLARRARVAYSENALHRIRDTRPQVSLNAEDRAKNIANAFRADPALVSGKRVLVIDDVSTTGATLRACATALREAGAAAVWGLTVAAVRFFDPDTDQSQTSSL